MKLVIASILICLAVTEITHAQNCLTLVSGHGLYNPDSVKIDTCGSSGTYGSLFASKWFQVTFSYDIFHIPRAPHDTIIEVGWSEIDTLYSSVRSAFSNIETIWGHITLRKAWPEMPDTASGANNVFFLHFDNLVQVDSVIAALNRVTLTTAIFLGKPYRIGSIPNDIGLTPGIPFRTLALDGTTDPFTSHFHPLGWEWNIYKMKCPMAWEITKGIPGVYVFTCDDFYGGAFSHPDVTPNFKVIDAAHSGDGGPTIAFGSGHGGGCLPMAIAAGNNTYGMIGTAPGCTGIAGGCFSGSLGGPGPNVNQVDVDGVVNHYKRPPHVAFFANGGGTSDVDLYIKAGGIAIGSAGNSLTGFDFRTQDPFTWWIYPDVNQEILWGVPLYEDPNDPNLDVGPLMVGQTKDGKLYTPNCLLWPGCGGPSFNSGLVFYSGQEEFDWGSNFSTGKDKFDITPLTPLANAHVRYNRKRDSFMDLVAPGRDILTVDPSASGYQLNCGSSFSAPEVAGIAALMCSVNEYLGTTLDGSNHPIDGWDVQRRANRILTFTADKLYDYDNYPYMPPLCNAYYPASGYPSLTNDGVYLVASPPLDPRYAGQGWQFNYVNQSNDILQRSWAQRMGFGRVNAYRAVANAIPLKGPLVYSASNSSTLFAGASTNENSKALLHFGAYRSANGYRPDEDSYTGTQNNAHKIEVLQAGGVLIPNQTPIWPHENQGQTFLYATGGVPTILSVYDNEILAIDGIVKGDGTAGNKITSTANGKILITGYLDDVDVTGTTRIDDLIIYSQGYQGSGEGQTVGRGGITVASGQNSEVYGVVKLQAAANFKLGGNLTVQPGGEIHMDGLFDLVIPAGSNVTMMASSKIASSHMRVIVAGTLEISGLLPVDINCKVEVLNGGQLIIDANAHLRLDQFVIDRGGALTCSGGGRLSLMLPVYNYCNGHLYFGGDPSPRSILTGGISLCGYVNQCAGIVVQGAPNTPATLLTDIDMRRTDDSDVFIKIINADKKPFMYDHFSANRTFAPLVGGPTVFSKNPILAMLNTPAAFKAPLPSIANPIVYDCWFFDEAGPLISVNPTVDAFKFTGLWMQNMLSSYIMDSYFTNLSWGSYVQTDLNSRYIGNTYGASPAGTDGALDNAIFETGSAGTYCTNTVKNSVVGVTAVKDLRGYMYDNPLQGNGPPSFGAAWCLSTQNSGDYDLRGNGVSGYNAYGVFAYAGSTINLTIANSKVYGRNAFVANPGAHDIELLRFPFNMSDSLHGNVTVKCGFNSFGPASSCQIHGPSGPTPLVIKVDFNKWGRPGNTCGIAPCGVTMHYDNSANLCSSLPSVATCGDAADDGSCSPTSSVPHDNYPSTQAWTTTDSTSPSLRVYFWNASSMLLTDTFDVVTRRAKARDELHAASLIDSIDTYLPRVLSDYRSVLYASGTPAELKSSIVMLKGQVHEMMGDIDSAIACYNTISSSYSAYSDSLYALWALQRLSFSGDTVYGTAYDSAQSAYLTRVYSDLLAMVGTDGPPPAPKTSSGSVATENSTGLTITVHPNPAQHSSRICVESLTGGLPSTIEVVNVEGERIALLYDETPAGDLGFCLSYDCSKLLSGTYYVHVYNSVMGRSVKLEVIK